MARVSVVVRVRDATREGVQRVRHSINTLNREVTSGLGGMFQDGIGQAIGNALQKAAANPYVAAGIATLAAVLALQLGAALSGALVLAFGGAFVALGAMAAARSKQVKSAFSGAMKSVKKDFADAGKPLIPVLVHAATLLRQVSHSFAPQFKQAMKEAAPALKTFLDNLSAGIKDFAATGFQPMMQAFDKLLNAINWKGFLDDLGRSFANLGRAVSSNTKSVGGVFDNLLSVIPMTINMLAGMTRAWGKVAPFFGEVWKTIKFLLTPAVMLLGLQFKVMGDLMAAAAGPLALINKIMQTFYNGAIKPVGDYIGRVFGPIWHGILDGFTAGWQVLKVGLVPVLRDLWSIMRDTGAQIISALIPGLGGLDDKSQKAGQTIQTWIIGRMQALSDWLVKHRDDISFWAANIGAAMVDAAKIVHALTVALIGLIGLVRRHWSIVLLITGVTEVRALIRAIESLWAWVHRNWSAILRFSGIQSVINLIHQVQNLYHWVNRNWSRVVGFRLSAGGVVSAIKGIWNWVNRDWTRSISFHVSLTGAVGTAKKLLGLAHGGVRGLSAAATGGVRSNMTLVGEHGPEIVDLAPGSHVRSNSDSRRLMNRNGSANGQVDLMVHANGDEMSRFLALLIQKYVQPKGGNIQLAIMGKN